LAGPIDQSGGLNRQTTSKLSSVQSSPSIL
jgi:hypothetical protein